MFNVYRKEIEWGGRKLTLETGKIARQADGAVLVTYGETTVLCTAVAAKSPKPGVDFFPLTVNYQEKTFAAGKIPGGFFKREGRPTEKETLVSRLIDRPIRPLFADGFRNETQVICTVLSHDLENDPDIVAMVGASAALTLSGIPFLGPIGAARVGYVDGQYVLNPTMDRSDQSVLDLVVAGTTEGVLMVESEAKELTEEVMLGAVMFGHTNFQPVIQAIIDLAEECAKEPWDLPEPAYDRAALKARLRETVGADVEAAYTETVKQARYEKIGAAKAKALEALAESFESAAIATEFKELEADILRGAVLKTGRRIDGRDTRTVRPIVSEVGVLPRAHGSALFTRGETQALVVTTLGTSQDEQIIDALEGEYREHFMLHYNFPPYSVGEAGRMGSPGRREIGHGKLAWRAVHPLLPSKEEFPYTLRVVSEVTESNGSSSMATVCGTSLSLMDAGAPLLRPVAGIAMGLIKEMAKALTGAREAVNQNAPRITVITIPKEKIRDVIGSGGKVIREIVEQTGAKIDIEDDGTVKVAAVDNKAAQAAIDWIKGIVAEPELNVVYTGKVVKVVDFGAFVNFLGSRDGLVHISELAPQRVAKVADVVKQGDEVKVKVIGFDDRGKVKLSMKQVDQATGEDLTRKDVPAAD